MLVTRSSAYVASCPREQFPREKNDCVIRALALAANRTYADVHAMVTAHGRKQGRGTPWPVVRLVAAALGGTAVHLSPRHEPPRLLLPRYAPTLAAFVRANPVGNFLVCKRGHAFAVLNGVVHDWGDTSGARTRVILAYRFDQGAR